MRIFVTGATGFIGSAIVPELINAGHQVLGMTRSEEGARRLLSAGAEVHRGTLEDLDALRAAAGTADGVIHVAFDHDFTNFAASCQKDARAIQALGGALAGSKRPLVITSGVGFGIAEPGQPATEDVFNQSHANPRVASELAGAAMLDAGVNVSVVRLPQVHDTRKQGLITPFIEITRTKGVCGYVDDGSNRWSAAHVSDVARLYRMALEAQQRGSRYHAVAEQGIPVRTIAEVIGRGLKLPVRPMSPNEAAEHFSWLTLFAGLDLPASSALTRERLHWQPTGPGLIADLEQMEWATA